MWTKIPSTAIERSFEKCPNDVLGIEKEVV